MALTYDIKKDVRYQQGREEGKEEGKEEVALALLKSGLLTDEQIAQAADIPLEQVRRIKARIKTN